MGLLSVICPCYNEEESVALFYQELMKTESFFRERNMEMELLFIDDGSKDQTVSEVKKIIAEDGSGEIKRGLCGHNGRGFTGSAFSFAGNV